MDYFKHFFLNINKFNYYFKHIYYEKKYNTKAYTYEYSNFNFNKKLDDIYLRENICLPFKDEATFVSNYFFIIFCHWFLFCY